MYYTNPLRISIRWRGLYDAASALSTQLLVKWTLDAAPSSAQNVRVNHCCFDILVAKKFLYRADVVATFEQMRREAMSKRVTTAALNYPSLAKCASNCGLCCAVGKMMPSLLSAARINRSPGRRKQGARAE